MSSNQPDDCFFEQLTLGLTKVLNSTPRITNVACEKREPCERAQITTWEQRHNVYLPDDIKRFYLSTDGFSFYWSYQYSPNDVRRVGYFNVPHLLQITLMRENIETPQTTIINSRVTTVDGAGPQHGSNSSSCRTKIFELSNICDIAKVCLVYNEGLDLCNLKVYLLETQTLKFHILADTFTDYLRMTIVHLGLPYWELCFSDYGVPPPWAEQLFLLLAPHLVGEHNEPRRSKKIGNQTSSQEQPINSTLDPAIFRTKNKSNRSK